jgi:hypothetical protein
LLAFNYPAIDGTLLSVLFGLDRHANAWRSIDIETYLVSAQEPTENAWPI